MQTLKTNINKILTNKKLEKRTKMKPVTKFLLWNKNILFYLDDSIF